ncbi:hypothetical protein RUM43_003240 [Polyplax serrata]|uniref:EB domain-containing protein n=1 Tax=Polyplax serrata TaxID=468196 RepID=A0AAN8RWW4_POLSC
MKGRWCLGTSGLSFCTLLVVFLRVLFDLPVATGTKNCEGFGECVIFSGYTCKNNKCVCDPDEPGLFRCIPPKFYGERCNSDQECQLGDYNLQCLKSEIRICKCKRGYVWDLERKKCLPTLDDDMYSGRFDPVRDLIIPGLIVMTIGAMVYLGFKLFCNCGKLWRRRRHQEIARELEEISTAPHQQAWIASYRVFSPYNNPNRSSPTSFPIHPTPCMGLIVPSQLTQSPPSYEEALKHKVILSSYHNPVPQPVVPAYTLPAPDVHRQYQTLPPNATASSSIILNPTIPPTPSALKTSAMSGHRPFPITQDDTYGLLPLSNDWTQLQYSGTTGQVWNTQPNPSPSACRVQEPPSQADASETAAQHSRVPPVDVWTPHQRRHTQLLPTHLRLGAFRPRQPKSLYRDIP